MNNYSQQVDEQLQNMRIEERYFPKYRNLSYARVNLQYQKRSE